MYQQSAIRDRFLYYYESQKITQTEIANAIGTKQSSIQRWFSDKSNAMPDLTAIHYLISKHGLDFDWLMTGTFSKENNTKECQTIKTENTDLAVVVEKLTEEIKGLSESIKNLKGN